MPTFAAAESLPDPTRPFGYDTSPIEIVEEDELPREQVNWRLSGIRISPDDRSAILNGRLLREGEMVDGAELVEIRPASVLIDFDNKRIRVDLLTLDIKQERTSRNTTTGSDNS
ncbi:general secretion pathway protein GspB [Methylohalomonas lacus]|uniref:general secretion pathway protein GspB n=1 Tax=Methylohalomonas lacus TaxID=398773 RepID=UPI00216A751D|nr:general secretion pathway protein GspB [Methylohalomonas lacus]